MGKKYPIVVLSLATVFFYVTLVFNSVAERLVSVTGLFLAVAVVYVIALSPRLKIAFKTNRNPIVAWGRSAVLISCIFVWLAVYGYPNENTQLFYFGLAGLLAVSSSLVFWFGPGYYARVVAPGLVADLKKHAALIYSMPGSISGINGVVKNAHIRHFIIKDITAGEYNIVQLLGVREITSRVNEYHVRILLTTDRSFRKAGEELKSQHLGQLKVVPGKYAFAVSVYLAGKN